MLALSSLFGGGRVTSAGVNQLFDEKLETNLLNGSITDKGETTIDLKNITSPGDRNNLQDRIIAAANQRCGLYQNYLKQLQGKTDLSLGILSTILGGAGAIVTAADTARALSGSAGIASGTRAEFNQAIFLNSAIPIIVKGIERRRERLKTVILSHRNDDITTYTPALAVADAIDYHNACTIGKGLEEADVALELTKNPGLEEMNKVLDNLTQTNQKLSDLQKAKATEEIDKLKEEIKALEEKKAKLKEEEDKKAKR
jgi:hypothetical protein